MSKVWEGISKRLRERLINAHLQAFGKDTQSAIENWLGDMPAEALVDQIDTGVEQEFLDKPSPADQKLLDKYRAPTRFHRVFSGDEFIKDVPWKDDPNDGLPDWFFLGAFTGQKGQFYSFEIDLSKDTVEWAPAMGPAPIWQEKFSKFKSNKDMLKAFNKWGKENY